MYYVLVTIKRAPYRTIGADKVSKQIWRCVAYRADFADADHVAERFQNKSFQVSVTHESAITFDRCAQYREEADACASRGAKTATTSR